MSHWFDVRGVTTGLTIAAVVWLASFARSRWGLRKRKAEAEWDKRTTLRSGASIVSHELGVCAEVAERCERGDVHVPEAVSKLSIDEWPQRRGEMGELRDEDSDLWHDLNDTYAALKEAKRNGGYPPKAVSLRDLSQRIHQIAEGERVNLVG